MRGRCLGTPRLLHQGIEGGVSRNSHALPYLACDCLKSANRKLAISVAPGSKPMTLIAIRIRSQK
jgi:hypothetical protein